MIERIGEWICTATGKSFYPLDPRPEDICEEDIGHALSQLCRFGGHCSEFYSVADHSLRVARLVQDSGHPHRVVLRALLHDASEAYLVDLPRPIKRMIPQYKEIERHVQNAIFRKFGLEESEEDDNIVHIADNVLLATEKRDLMPATSLAWSPLPPPLPGRIVPLTSEIALISFQASLRILLK